MTYSPAKERECVNKPWTDDELQESLLREYLRQMLYKAAEELEKDQDDDLQP